MDIRELAEKSSTVGMGTPLTDDLGYDARLALAEQFVTRWVMSVQAENTAKQEAWAEALALLAGMPVVTVEALLPELVAQADGERVALSVVIRLALRQVGVNVKAADSVVERFGSEVG